MRLAPFYETLFADNNFTAAILWRDASTGSREALTLKHEEQIAANCFLSRPRLQTGETVL